jgi:acetyl esterase/lipase
MKALTGLSFRLGLAGAVAAGLALSAHAASPGEDLAARAVVNPQIFSQGDDPYPDHHGAFAGGVTGLPDVTYAIRPGWRPLKLDLYLPPASFAGPRPTVVFIHGGGWVGGGPRLSGAFDNWPNVLAAMAARGYVVAAVSYRFSGEAPSPAAIQDVKSAIRWLRANADRHRIDKGRVMTWGGSAGGQLAALAATSCGAAALEPPAGPRPPGNANVEKQTAGTADPDAQSDCVQGAVTWYGIFDFRTMPLDRRPAPYLGCDKAGCTDEQLRQPSAAAYVTAKSPPMLMIHGAADRTVPVAQSQDFFRTLQAAGVRSELLVIPGVDHSFIGATPDATRAASRQALARTIDFIDGVIGDRPTR